MIIAADVLIDRRPICRLLRCERHLGIFRIEISKIVPARIHECIHRVRLPLCRFTAFRTSRLVKLQHLCKRRFALTGKRSGIRQFNRQILVFFGHNPAFIAINYRYRRAPKPLPRNSPIPYAKCRRRFAKATLSSVRGHFFFRVFALFS